MAQLTSEYQQKSQMVASDLCYVRTNVRKVEINARSIDLYMNIEHYDPRTSHTNLAPQRCFFNFQLIHIACDHSSSREESGQVSSCLLTDGAHTHTSLLRPTRATTSLRCFINQICTGCNVYQHIEDVQLHNTRPGAKNNLRNNQPLVGYGQATIR